MRLLLLILLIATLIIASNALAGTFRVHYTCAGNGRDIQLQAKSSAKAQRMVHLMFPDCYVTGVHEVKTQEELHAELATSPHTRICRGRYRKRARLKVFKHALCSWM
jgi:hypothetical protein